MKTPEKKPNHDQSPWDPRNPCALKKPCAKRSPATRPAPLIQGRLRRRLVRHERSEKVFLFRAGRLRRRRHGGRHEGALARRRGGGKRRRRRGRAAALLLPAGAGAGVLRRGTQPASEACATVSRETHGQGTAGVEKGERDAVAAQPELSRLSKQVSTLPTHICAATRSCTASSCSRCADAAAVAAAAACRVVSSTCNSEGNRN